MPKPGFIPTEQDADKFLRLYDEQERRKERSPEPTNLVQQWVKRDGYEESRCVIVYPRDSQFIIDRLDPENGWVEVEPRKEQDTLERATAQAQSLANANGVPYSVREVIAH